MTPALARVRALVERWKHRIYLGPLLTTDDCVNDLSALLPELEAREAVIEILENRLRLLAIDRAYIERLEKALHPGPMPMFRGKPVVGRAFYLDDGDPDKNTWELSFANDAAENDYEQRGEASDWCNRANLYESTTGKRLGDSDNG